MQNNIIKYDKNITFDNIKIVDSSFISPISEEEKKFIIKHYEDITGSKPFNGKVIRLEKLSPVIEVSEIDFFDLLTTNILLNNTNFNIKDYNFLYQLVEIRKKIMSKLVEIRSAEDILTNKYISNAISVSTLLIDADGYLGIVERKTNTVINSGKYADTSTGTVSTGDISYCCNGNKCYLYKNPFLDSAKRELLEETNIKTKLYFDGIIFPIQKMQPVFLYSGKLDKSWADLIPDIKKAKDFYNEIKTLKQINLKDIDKFVAKNNFSDASAFHCELLAKKNRIIT